MDSGEMAALVVLPRWRSDRMIVDATMGRRTTIGHSSASVATGKDKQDQTSWAWNDGCRITKNIFIHRSDNVLGINLVCAEWVDVISLMLMGNQQD